MLIVTGVLSNEDSSHRPGQPVSRKSETKESHFNALGIKNVIPFIFVYKDKSKLLSSPTPEIFNF